MLCLGLSQNIAVFPEHLCVFLLVIILKAPDLQSLRQLTQISHILQSPVPLCSDHPQPT